MLNQLSKPPKAGAWQPRFSKKQTVELLNVVLDEVVQNPDWLIKPAGKKSSMLATAIDAALEALRNIPAERISSQTAQNVIEATIRAVAMRKDLLDEIPLFGKQKKAILTVLELMFDTIMPTTVESEVLWILGRNEVFNKIVSMVLSKISEIGVSEDILLDIRKKLNETVQVIATGKQFSIESLITTINNITLNDRK